MRKTQVQTHVGDLDDGALCDPLCVSSKGMWLGAASLRPEEPSATVTLLDKVTLSSTLTSPHALSSTQWCL